MWKKKRELKINKNKHNEIKTANKGSVSFVN